MLKRKNYTAKTASTPGQSFRPSDLIRRILLSWLSVTALECLLLPSRLRALDGLEGLAKMSFSRVILLTCAGTLFLSFLSRFKASVRAERLAFPVVFLALAVLSLQVSFSWPFLCSCVLAFLILLLYAIRGWNASSPETPSAPKAGKACVLITAGAAILFFLFVCAWTVGRVYSFSSPTYDLGIFSQMFYYMKESGLPMTTLERDGLLSHFCVHVSPIYYLLLPFYLLHPAPVTLQILQAILLASSVIPLWKLGACHGLSAAERMFLCLTLLLYPAFSGGTGYDIHENCFLTPLLLWLFYGIDRGKPALTALAALLTLMVKEDAAVYTAVVALWLMVKTVNRAGERQGACIMAEKEDRNNLLTGLFLLTMSLVWFFAATAFLAKSGDGVMAYRYDNLLYGGSSSLLTVVKACILSPMKALYECVDIEKLPFIALTLLPLLGLPLFTRRYERYLLLIPYVLVNLMSDYTYQHNIFFQYTFGSTAFLLYLTLLNLADLKSGRKHVQRAGQNTIRTFCRRLGLRPILAALTAASCASCFAAVVVPKALRYPMKCVLRQDHYQELTRTLSLIPEDASVTASTFYTTVLSQRELLYDLRHCSQEHLLDTDYIVLNPSAENDFKAYASPGRDNGYEALTLFLERQGYEPYAEAEDLIILYRSR